MAYYEKVAVIGAGTMGNGIAQTFATHGSSVALVDIDAKGLEKGVAAIRASLDKFASKAVLTKEAADAAFANVHPSSSMDAVKGAQLVVEAVSEREAVKKSVFGALDALTGPDCILATNTSSISITAIAASTKRPDKVIGMHFMNPVPLMKLVEIIRGQETSDATTKTIVECSSSLDKTPVEANDYPGFVSNRVLMPMINEAFYAWMEGVAKPEDIDQIMLLGCNFPMGPLRLADFIGLDVCHDIMMVLHKELGNPKFFPCPLLRQLVQAGRLGDKTGRGVYEYPAK